MIARTEVAGNGRAVSIFTPLGRDAAVVSGLLRDGGFATIICRDREEFMLSLGEGTEFVIVTEEAMHGMDLAAIDNRLEAQPPWSDLPFILMTQRGGGIEKNPSAQRFSDLLGNVTFVERPFHPTTLLSVARSVSKARFRQFEYGARIEQLNEGERRLQTALLAGRLGTWELDLATNELTVSATCKANFGRPPDAELSYQDLMSSIHADDRDRVQAAVRHTIEHGDDYAIEYRNVCPDGSTHWLEVRARLVKEKLKGGATRLVGVSSDITSRKTAEDAAKRANELLEQRVRERTAELEAAHTAVLSEMAQRAHTENLLRQSQKMESIGQLTGGVAHDFNNLLMAVMANLGLLRKHVSGDARATHLIMAALQGVERGAALTQRLLAFARRQELNVEPTDVAGLVRNMTDLIQRSISSEIELIVQAPDSAGALVDANQLELAILNLAINARDAMPDGGTIELRVEEKDVSRSKELAAGRYVSVSVVDTGTGMTPETLARATEPFFSTKELGKGTGLGLSMIQGLAEQLHGTLKLTSELGRGTRAELLLPSAIVLNHADPVPAEPAPAEATIQATILFVDDDALVAMSTVDMLTDLGHNVVEANSAAQALDILRQGQKIDLLITDYSMPKMNGAQLALAARELRPDLPIMLATGYAELPQGQSIVLPRITKPYMQDQLASEIGKILRAA